MAEVAKVMSVAARQIAAGAADLAQHHGGHFDNMAKHIWGSAGGARALDDRALIGFAPTSSVLNNGAPAANPALLRSYWLRRVEISGGRVVRRPIGVIIGDHDLARENRQRFRAPDASHFGHVQVRLREDPLEFLARWQAGQVSRLPQAKWVPSPYFESAVRQQRPPVVIALHHGDGEFQVIMLDDPPRRRFGVTVPENRFRTLGVDGGQLVELLQRDRILQGALDANPGSDIWLLACDAGGQAQVVADAFGRTTHAPSGLAIVHTSDVMVQQAKDGTALPYAVGKPLLRDMMASLHAAPLEQRVVASAGGWNITTVWVQPDPVTGKFVRPVVTCHPN